MMLANIRALSVPWACINTLRQCVWNVFLLPNRAKYATPGNLEYICIFNYFQVRNLIYICLELLVTFVRIVVTLVYIKS